MPKYIAKQSIGHYRPGDEIKGLEDKQLQALLTSGAIAEQVEQKRDQDVGLDLNALQAEITDLKAKNKTLEDGKVVLEQEITDLKAKVADLEKSNAAEKKPAAKPTTEK